MSKKEYFENIRTGYSGEISDDKWNKIFSEKKRKPYIPGNVEHVLSMEPSEIKNQMIEYTIPDLILELLKFEKMYRKREEVIDILKKRYQDLISKKHSSNGISTPGEIAGVRETMDQFTKEWSSGPDGFSPSEARARARRAARTYDRNQSKNKD